MGLAKKVQGQEQQAISPEVIQTLEAALKCHQADDLKQAEKLYKKALAASRQHSEVAILCAVFYQQIGRHKYVITLLKKVLLKDPLNFKALHLIGKSYLNDRQFEQALQALHQTHTLDPNHAEVCFKKGLCHHKMGQFDFVLPLYEKAYSGIEGLAPGDQQALYHSLADYLMSKGRGSEAVSYLEDAIARGLANEQSLLRLSIAKGEGDASSMRHILDALMLDKSYGDAQAVLALACEKGNIPSLVNSEMRDVIEAAFQNNQVNHQSLALPWVRNLFLHLDETSYEKVFNTPNYDALVEQLNDEKIKAELYSTYFASGLKAIRPISLDMEQFYRFLRMHYLLKIKDNKTLSDDDLTLLGAMAEQCYFNEYVFSVTEEEVEFIKGLKERLEGLSSFDERQTQELLLFASYEPLLSLGNHKLLKNLKTSHVLADVIELQVKEPLEEQRLAKKIKSIGSIENEVSKSVRQQYEENPYPRYRSESMFKPFHTQVIDDAYRGKLDVLIAGCGTGKHLLSSYNFYGSANFAAIDISKTSLAYAKRKLIDFNLDDKFQLYHCDILEADKAGGPFDFIECCGVLHHMEDPLAGLQSLSGLLKPNGSIKLALYSRIARQSVYDVREFIQKEGFEPTAEGIRACREKILETKFSSETPFPIYQWRDFKSLSECRDLMFHEQEICYDLNEVEALLNAAGLQFEVMLVSPSVQDKFAESFPIAEDAKDLKCWANYEEANPTAFSAMYQFRARKKI